MVFWFFDAVVSLETASATRWLRIVPPERRNRSLVFIIVGRVENYVV